MKCPVDDENLVMFDRSGVEIDYCPKCRGVWLDRGELDKIIERSASAAPRDVDREYQVNKYSDDEHRRRGVSPTENCPPRKRV